MSLLFAEPTQVWLEIAPDTQANAWQESQVNTDNSDFSGQCWTMYLNALCLNTLFPWLQEEFDGSATICIPKQNTYASWSLVNGTLLNLGDTKLALIPSDALPQEEFVIPQEWVDLPAWTADYYLAIKVDATEKYVNVWGYTTHAQIKSVGEYDAMERLYCLDRQQIEQDLTTLWTIQRLELVQPEQAATIALAKLTTTQVDNLIQRLVNPEKGFPRLSIPFAQWGALLEDEASRQQLLRQRAATLQGKSMQQSVITNLRQIVQGAQALASSGWQSVDDLFGAQAVRVAYSARRSDTPEILQAKEVELICGQTRHALRLVLQMQLEEDERLAVRVQLYPASDHEHLPETTRLALLNLDGDILQSIEARQADNYVQLRRFKCPTGYEFCIEIQLEGTTVTESFSA